jgi:effector-binding domain-containing protein
MNTNKSFFRLVTLSLLFCLLSWPIFGQSTGNYKIEVKQVAAIKAAVIKVTTSSTEMSNKMSELYGKIFAYLGENKIQLVGPPFAVYYAFDPKGNTTFEVGAPINEKLKESADIKYKEFPAMKVISTMHIGPYDQITPVYAALEKYAKENKIAFVPVSWEIYLTDPNTEKDPNKYQTLVYFPVK